MNGCASCGGRLSEVMNFGEVALAGAFLKDEEFKGERKFPLSLAFCEECSLVQVPERIGPEELFEEYFYFSSAIGTLRKHFAAYASEIVERFKPASVLEIGCNDGVLLKPLADLGVARVVGVDPAANVIAKIADERVEVVNAFYGPGLVAGKFDVIVANNVMAHVENLNAVVSEIAFALAPGGAFVMEVNRLDALVSGLQYDWVYHEHRYYFSALSLGALFKRHGMELFDVKLIGNHAGSARYYACRKGEREETLRVGDQVARENWQGLFTAERMRRFADDAAAHRDRLRELVLGAVEEGKTVAGYGACGRTNTMLQFCGLDHRHISFIVDDAPAKRGFYTPGSHIQIVSADALELQPDILIVFAWSFLREIEPKLASFRGQVVVPLPDIYQLHERAAA